MIANIQVLRAIAASIVVYYHLQAMVNTEAVAQLNSNFGGSGVDIFFVISGFIMFHTTRSFKRTAAEFWIDRIARIVPLYWFATFVLIAIYLTGRHPNGLSSLNGRDVITSLLFIPNIRSDGIREPVLSLGWTLIYEMFFYLVFGLTFFMRSHLKSLIAVTSVFIAAIAIGVGFAPLPFAADYFTNPIMLEFSAGCLLGLVFERWRFAKTARPVALGYGLIVAGVAAIIAADIIASGSYYDEHVRPLLNGVPAFMIVAGALVLERAGHRWNSRTLLLLGSASYAIYLVHPFAMQPITKAIGYVANASPLSDQIKPITTLWGGYLFDAIVAIPGFVVALAAGVACHIWIERPLQNLMRRPGRRPDEALPQDGHQPGSMNEAPSLDPLPQSRPAVRSIDARADVPQ